MRSASGLAFDRDGNLLIAEQYSMRIRRLAPDGTVTTFAGTGAQGSTGDGGPATAATFQYPAGVATSRDGDVYVSDQDGTKVRRIAADGTISTFAGTGVQGFDGDGGPAVDARIWFPFGLAVADDGTVYLSDRYNNAIRTVDGAGIISSVAGGPRSKPWVDMVKMAPTPPALVTPAGGPTPSLVWDETFFSGSDANAARAVAVGAAGEIYVAGDLGSGADWSVLCLNGDGTQRWKTVIETPNLEIPHALALAPDGTLIVAGETTGTAKDLLVVALTAADGRERWRHTSAEPGNQVAHGVAVDPAGNVYVAGESQNDWMLLSLTPAGAPRWNVRDGVGTARSVAVDPQGHLLVAGDTRMLWRVDKRDGASGAPIWRENVAPTLQHPHGAQANAVRVDRDGNATIAGLWIAPAGRTLRVERRDPSGNALWAYIEPPGDVGDAGRAVALGDGGIAYIAGNAGTDWLLLALDNKGAPLWRLTHDGGGGTINPDVAMALAVVPPKDLVVAGVVHPVPPKLPNLGWVQWRLARYALP
jgi:sugar lactone lactonase YvrE